MTQLRTTRPRRPFSARNFLLGENFQLTLLILPGFALFLLFNYFPLYGLVIAFKNFYPQKGIFGSPWCGFDNFKFFFKSVDAFRVTRNTVCYSGAFIIVDTVFAVMVALMLYNLRSKRSLKLYNTVMILPRFLSQVIIAFITYAVLSPRIGVLNSVIRVFGGQTVDWYGIPGAWPFILTIVHVWSTVGMNSVIYYASLMGMDTDLLEAADIDGANRWQQIRSIMVPHLVPLMCIQGTLAVGRIFSGDFGLFYQNTLDIGTLYPTTDIIPTYVFRGLKGGNLKMSTAVGLFQNVAGFAMVMLTNAIIRKVSPENSLF